MNDGPIANIDERTVEGFGHEWDAFAQDVLPEAEYDLMFERYFGIFPFDKLPHDAEGFDLGCGSGRFAYRVQPKVGLLHCIDPAEKALAVSRRRLANADNVRFHHAMSDNIPLADESQDFGYCLGVLHHIPDSARALRDAVAKLKPGAPFLVYIYYRFDNRPAWFRRIWQASDLLRRGIFRLPFRLRKAVTGVIAAAVYWPLARASLVLEKAGYDVDAVPLSAYRRSSFYSMRTDSLDRFGTRLEQRFTKQEIETMMRASGLTDIVFSDGVPYWVACGTKV